MVATISQNAQEEESNEFLISLENMVIQLSPEAISGILKVLISHKLTIISSLFGIIDK